MGNYRQFCNSVDSGFGYRVELSINLGYRLPEFYLHLRESISRIKSNVLNSLVRVRVIKNKLGSG